MSNETIPGDALPAHEGPGISTWVKRASYTTVMWVRKEPAAVQAIVLAFIAIGIAFQWWTWSDGQTGAVVGIAAALLGMFARSQVTPLVQPTARGRRLVPEPDEPHPAASAVGR